MLASSAEQLVEMTEHVQKFDTVIVGMGLTGYSCARYLSARGIDFAVVDSRTNPPMLDRLYREFPDVPLYTSGLEESVLCGARRLLVSPGVSLQEPAIRAAATQGVEITGDIELFCRQAAAPIIAITGSNGKSTVATLVAEMAAEAGMQAGLAGNIGVPALDLLEREVYGVFVLELSSFQLELVRSLNARAATVLNVSADHMDRYDSLADYARAKAAIFSGTGTMVLNRDDVLVAGMEQKDRRVIGFTLHEPDENDYGIIIQGDHRWLAHGGTRLLPVDAMQMAGDHNVANALAALALGGELGLDKNAMLDVLKRFTGLPHRCQWIADINKVRWINDSKGTNPGAACAAIRGLAGTNNVVLIAGGDGKGADFSSLAGVAADCLRAAIVIGRDGPRIKSVLEGTVPVHEAQSMESAVHLAANLVKENDVVLLSPACASFDMFEDYRERGKAFTAAVKALEVAE